MHKFKDLKVWQKSRVLSKEIYFLTNSFPKEELYGITSQIRRCVVSIPSNIAEGAGKNSNPEFNRFLDIANGSASELETLLILSNDIGLLSNNDLTMLVSQLTEIQKMRYSLKNAVLNTKI
jgi:four helix bundle protein